MKNRINEDGLPRRVPVGEFNGRTIKHLLDYESALAVNVALACARPLLIRGEPGTGKTQFAHAVARELEAEFVARVVDARTEGHELKWEDDALGRLADAQVYRAGGEWPSRINYIRPGPVWWAFDWNGAARHPNDQRKSPAPGIGTGKPENGVVLLIDEIDKADISVPNALLECLGQREFEVPGLDRRVTMTGEAPLVIFTTNTDRELPPAFVRRCVVLHMRVPAPEAGLQQWFEERAAAHFGDSAAPEVRQAAAAKISKDRAGALQRGARWRPGLAECIDLIAAALDRANVGEAEDPVTRISRISRFVLAKHDDPGPMPTDEGSGVP